MRATQIDVNWHPGLPIYASEVYLKTVGDEYGWIGGADTSGKLRCILPFTIIRKPMFRLARFRVETIPLAEELTLGEEKSFLNNVLEFFRSRKVDMIIPASNNTIFRTCPDGAVAAPYGSYIIDLTQPEEAIWDNLHAKHRNVIRNAMKTGVQIRSGIEYLDTAFGIVRDTLKRSAMDFMSHDSCKRFVRGLGENARVFVADLNGIAQGCAIIPFSNHGAYYVYGGSIPEPATGAMNLLHWEAIRVFRGLGVKRYDFVGVRLNPEKGSKQEGLMRFKERFGGRLVQGYMWKYPFHPLKYFIYGLAVRLRRGGDIVDQERHKVPGKSEAEHSSAEDSKSAGNARALAEP